MFKTSHVQYNRKEKVQNIKYEQIKIYFQCSKQYNIVARCKQ